MALQEFTQNVSIHNTMPDEPPYAPDEIKDIFDSAPELIKTWINETLIPYINELEAKVPKITSGTDAPSGGNDGDIYLRY